MANDLITIQRELAPVMRPLEPILEQLLPPTLPPEQLINTLYVSIANNPSLARATRPSLIQAATSAAVLALTIDGVSGQGYLVPFKGSAQFISGYKGMCTLAGRSRRTLEGFVVREGDDFKFDETTGDVAPGRVLGRESERSIVAAYAISRAEGLPTILRVMSLDQILEVRNASAGWRMQKDRSIWAKHFDAMARKTPMRRASNDIPVLPLQQASALETMHDLGRHAWLHQDGGVVTDDGREHDPADVVRQARERSEVRAEQPSAGEVLDGEFVTEAEGLQVRFPGDKASAAVPSERFAKLLERAIAKEQSDEHRKELIALNRATVEGLMGSEPGIAGRLIDVMGSYE